MFSRIFDVNNGFFVFMGKVGDFIILNVIFLLTCLPIITIGPAVTALYYVIWKMKDRKDVYVIRDYFYSFKQNFKQGIIIWIIMAAVLAVIGIDVFFSDMMGGTIGSVFKTGAFILIVFWFFTFSYVFPVLSKFVNTTKRTFQYSIYLALRYLPNTIIMAIVNAIPAACFLIGSVFVVAGFWWYTLCGFALGAYMNMNFLYKEFKKFIPEEEPILTPEEKLAQLDAPHLQ